MRRLLALIWLALSLAMASGPAFAVPSPDCPMAGSSQMASSHDEMDCCAASCAPECAAVCPSAVEPTIVNASAPTELLGERLIARPANPLLAADLTGADPPPRTTYS